MEDVCDTAGPGEGVHAARRTGKARRGEPKRCMELLGDAFTGKRRETRLGRRENAALLEVLVAESFTSRARGRAGGDAVV